MRREGRKKGERSRTMSPHHSIRSVTLRKPWFMRQHRGRLCLAVGQAELTCTRETAMKAWLHCSCSTLHYTPYEWRARGEWKEWMRKEDSHRRWMNKISVRWEPAKIDQRLLGWQFTSEGADKNPKEKVQCSQTAIKRHIYSLSAVNDPPTVNTLVAGCLICWTALPT